MEADTNSNLLVGSSCSSGQMKHHQPKTKSKTSRSSGGNKSNKKKSIKVVYISNPMKVTASASEFRALVQQLTGQDADDLPPDLHPTSSNPMVEISSGRRRHPEISDSSTTCTQYYDDHDEPHQHLYDDVDGLFLPEMLDSFVPAAIKGFL
ncbi:hypothetical protein ACLB2K_063296 [Fragaria x ananassa]